MIVRLDGLTKTFPVQRTWRETLRAPFAAPRTTVVENVSFSVAEGEIFGLLGQNGAGKTTIFKMLSTLILADAGTATIAGFDVRHEGGAVRRSLAPVRCAPRSIARSASPDCPTRARRWSACSRRACGNAC